MVNDKKLNIAMFGHKRIPSREGGIEIVVEELSTRMVQQGHSVTCFNRSGHHVSGAEYDGCKKNDYKGVKLVALPTIDRKGFAALTSSVFGAFKAAIGKYDVVHIHAEGPAFMCWLPKIFGKKVIVSVHGLDWNRAKWGKFASWYIKSGERNAVRFADEMIVLSQSVKDYFLSMYGRKTVFIPNGVSKPEIVEAKEIKKQWGLEKDAYILFLGRLVPEKGVHYLIEAYKKIKNECPDKLNNKKLVIVGGSSDTDVYIQKLKMLCKDVIFTGFQQGRVLDELYSNAYVYVLPSDLEGMSLSLLEAMSYGNCCLVSSIKECTEVIEDKAVIFKKGNITDLAEKLQMVCSNEEMVKKYKCAASQFICNKYNWNEVVNKTLQLYES